MSSAIEEARSSGRAVGDSELGALYRELTWDKEKEASQKVNEYLKKSSNQVIFGNYTDDVTLLGTAAQIGSGLLGMDA